MIASPSPRRLNLAAMVVLLALLLAAMLLALPSSSLARAHKASCHVSSHAKHGARKCAARTHKAKPTRAARHSSHKLKSEGAHSPLDSEEAGDNAKCEDGSAPSPSPEGAFSCEDGSEPSCAAGLIAVPSSDGATLLCEAIPAETEAEGEPEEG